MRENEFEKIKQELEEKLPEYLKKRGINPITNFRCLNPEDDGSFPSMSYDSIEHKVKCVHCNAKYSIFDLIGIDYNISDFAHQFIKAHEMFLGKLSIGLIDYLKNGADDKDSSSQGDFSPPFFEIEDNFSTNNKYSDLNSISPSSFATPKFGESNRFNQDEDAFSKSSNDSSKDYIGIDFKFDEIQDPISDEDNFSNFTFETLKNETEQMESNVDSSLSFIPDDLEKYNYVDYLTECTQNVIHTDYFKKRGLSDSVIRRFRLGYDDRFNLNFEQNNAHEIETAAIIPYGMHGFCARNTDSKEKNDRYIKKGEVPLFNKVALEQEGPIFITEGEFDALSIETLGYRAIALGGAGNIKPAIKAICECKENHIFYICPDNDEVGFECANNLYKSLCELDKDCKIINLSAPFKDINDALLHDSQSLKARIDNIEKIERSNQEKLDYPYSAPVFITNNAEINRLDISDELYAFTGNSQTLRYLVADIIKNRSAKILYLAKNYQCRYLSMILSKTLNSSLLHNTDNFNVVAIDELNILDDLERIINNQKVLNETHQKIIVDLTSLEKEKAKSIIETIAEDKNRFSKGIIVLCNDSMSDICAAVCIQVLSIESYEKNQIIIKTIENAQTTTFVRGFAE